MRSPYRAPGDPVPHTDTPERMTLLELAERIAFALEVGVPKRAWVVAEIAQANQTPKGHLSITLVERAEERDLARMQAWVWVWQRRIVDEFESATGQRLAKGMEVLLHAEVRFDAVWGLSLTVIDIDATYTLGALARLRQQALDRLRAEGLLERNKSLAFPVVPQRIAIVSSAQAAGYGDFVHQLENNAHGYRFSHRLFPSPMQGEEAPAGIAAAFRAIAAQAGRFDLVVVLRGGGSALDLSCFDTYEVGAAIGSCPLPVVTGIGHERDDTLADLAAHTRAKTPTAVADTIVGACRQFEQRLADLGSLLVAAARETVDGAHEVLDDRQGRLERASARCVSAARLAADTAAYRFGRQAASVLGATAQNVAVLEARTVAVSRSLPLREADALGATLSRLENRARRLLERTDDHLGALDDRIRLLDPARVLARGYSLTYHQGKLVRDARAVEPGAHITTRVSRGSIDSIVESVED